jgi:hypothetical protein
MIVFIECDNGVGLRNVIRDGITMAREFAVVSLADKRQKILEKLVGMKVMVE